MAGNTLLKKLILLGVALVVGIGAGWFIRARVLTPVGDSDKGGSFGASVVTEEQYNKAKYGMTYEEIKALFGSEGEFQKEMGGGLLGGVCGVARLGRRKQDLCDHVLQA